MNLSSLRLHYTQTLLICLLITSLYTMAITISNGIAQFENNFWNHAYLIANFTELRLALGDRVFSQVMIGKQGWMEYTKSNLIDSYQNTHVTTPQKLKTTQIKLQKLYDELNKRNITLLLMIAPNKITIYPDKLAANLKKFNKNSSLDLFTNYIHQYGPPILVDLRPALQNGRKKQDVYYHTDTHWNAYGAFIAYKEIMKELSKTYPELTSQNIDDYNIQKTKPKLLDIANLIGAVNLLESDIIFTPKKNDVRWTIFNNTGTESILISTTQQKTAPTLLMYRDSFGDIPKDFIASNFQKATFIRYNSKYKDTVSLHAIDIINPNIVIIEIVERIFNSAYGIDEVLDKFLREK